MAKLLIGIALIFCYAGFGDAAKKLPAYITACRRSDPNFNICAKESAAKAIPHMLKGDKTFKSPVLSPLHLDLIEIRPGGSLTIKLTDITLWGLETAVMEEIDFDFKKQHFYTRESFEFLNLQSHYNINGNILVLPITGDGPVNMTFNDLVVEYSFDYTLYKKKDGKDYMDPNIKSHIKYDIRKGQTYDFQNLFNGNKLLGEQTNKFINENTDALSQDIGASISETIRIVVTNILKQYLPVIPYDEIFLP